MNVLGSDTLKGDQAAQQGDCQRHYLDKIFGLVAGENSTQVQVSSKIEDGIVYDIIRCVKADRTRLKCDFAVTSTFFDRDLKLKPVIYDNFGNEYKAEKIMVANFKGNSSINVPLVADIETKGSMSFVNVNSQASSIAKLTLQTSVIFKDITVIY